MHYVQMRYKELTGWDAPISDGVNSKQLTAEQKVIDHKGRMILTEELGHSCIAIVKVYCEK